MPNEQELAAMIEEACVDAYNEEEQVTGLFTMLEENLTLPFATELLGVEVQVVAIDLTDSARIVAVCERGSRRQRVALEDLPLPALRPAGADWIVAYRQWIGG